MTNEQAIEAAIKFRFDVEFRTALGDIGVYKYGSRWIGPDDVGGYGRWQLHLIARGKSFAEAVSSAVEAFPDMGFAPEPT